MYTITWDEIERQQQEIAEHMREYLELRGNRSDREWVEEMRRQLRRSPSAGQCSGFG